MVEPATSKSRAAHSDPAAPGAPPTAPWPAHSPLDPGVSRFHGAARYLVWRRNADWMAVREGMHWSAGLAPRSWALRYRHWRLLASGMLLLGLAGGVTLAGTQGWASTAWAALLLAELALRVYAARHAGRWRNAALQRDGWQAVTRLRAISAADALTTAQIRAGRPAR